MSTRNTIYLPNLSNDQTVSLGASSTQSNPLSGKQVGVRLVADGGSVYVEWGSNPTATASSMYIPEDVVEYIALSGRQTIAALQGAAGGTLHITEVGSP